MQLAPRLLHVWTVLSAHCKRTVQFPFPPLQAPTKQVRVHALSTRFHFLRLGCFQAAAMAAADIMYALSYIASCQYIKSFALLTAVQSSGACFDLGDGLVLLTAAQGLIGTGFFIVTIVGIKGARCFDPENDETRKERQDFAEEDLYVNSGIDRDVDAPIDLPYQPSSTNTELANVGVNANDDAPLNTVSKTVTSSI